MNEELRPIHEKLDRIEKALIGDASVGQDGALPRIKRLEERQDALYRKFWIFSGAAGVVLFLWDTFKNKIL